MIVETSVCSARRIHAQSDRGFSLLEMLVATGIVTSALMMLGYVCALSVANNVSARARTYTQILAQQKLEQLRSLTWGFNALRLPVADTTTNTALPEGSSGGGTGLTPSPAGALIQNTAGYVDYMDQNGRVIGGGTNTPPDGTAYVRRWSIELLPLDPNTLVLQVLVTRWPNDNAVAEGVPTARATDQARVITIKTRKMS